MTNKVNFDISGAMAAANPIENYNTPKKPKAAAQKAAKPKAETATIKAAKELTETHYTQDQAQEVLGLCYNTFKKLLDAGELTRKRWGRHYWIKKADVENYLTSHFGG